MTQDRAFNIQYKTPEGGKQAVAFKLPAIPPLEGWDICELFREAIGNPEVLNSMGSDMTDPKAGTKLIMGLLISMSRDHVRQLRTALFKYVQFKTPEQADYMALEGLEDMAFGKLDPFSIYEVLGRCFAVNFSGYFKDWMSRLGIDLSALEKDQKSGTPQSAPGPSPDS